MADFMENFIPPSESKKHFEPPKLPLSIWNRLKSANNSDELFRQKAILKSQKYQTNAILPLLSVLESMGPADPNQKLVASAVQMLCSSNLQLSRLRRTVIAKHVNLELKQPLFSQPVTHLHMFGSDHDTSADRALKSQATSFQKMLTQKAKPFKSYASYPGPSLMSSDQTSIYDNPRPGPSSARAGSASSSNETYQTSSLRRGNNPPRQAQQPFRAGFRGKGRPFYLSRGGSRSGVRGQH